MHTQDLANANIDKIGSLFPNCLTERVVGKDKDGNDIIGRGIDFDRLRQELSKEIVEGPQERYQFTWPGKVKMIYIDPPYNTGNDFVYEDNFSETAGEFRDRSGMFDACGRMVLDRFTVNSESNGRFHTDWLNMMYPRLKVARDPLIDDGVIFISIDECEFRERYQKKIHFGPIAGGCQ